MELSLESDAEALWQDTLDLLADRNLPEATLAMLRNCSPTSMDDATMHLETSMRLVLKTVSKNAAVIEECLSQAAFEPMHLEVEFVRGGAAAHTPSSMSREEASSWAAETGDGRPAWDGPRGAQDRRGRLGRAEPRGPARGGGAAPAQQPPRGGHLSDDLQAHL